MRMSMQRCGSGGSPASSALRMYSASRACLKNLRGGIAAHTHTHTHTHTAHIVGRATHAPRSADAMFGGGGC
jgi:hypothetical protein